MVTYARAKAESLGVHGEVGMSPRPERLLVIALGLIVEGIAPADWFTLAFAMAIVALFSAITVLQRVLHVRHQLDQGEKR
jgi:CDP-diacylglycerol--glycerol-3-phosphate 3-phosphatidyltransferase